MRNKNFSKIFRTKLSVKRNLFLHQFTGKFLNELLTTASPLSFTPLFPHFWFDLPTTHKSSAPWLRDFWVQHVCKLSYTEYDTATALKLQSHVLRSVLIPEFFRSILLLEKAGKDTVYITSKKGSQGFNWQLKTHIWLLSITINTTTFQDSNCQKFSALVLKIPDS